MENTSDVKLPRKVGSLQCLVEGFKPCTFWLNEFATKKLDEELEYELQLQFERVVVMDYMIRNMNRTAENLLIRYDDKLSSDRNFQVKIAAIDNGLAFPYRHPSSWRPYKYHWVSLPLAYKPFSEETRSFILRNLTNAKLMSSLIEDLKSAFEHDVNFDQEYFEWQMMVMQGQILNLKAALQNRETPYELVQRRPLYVKTDPSDRTIPVLVMTDKTLHLIKGKF
ncbi:Phosphatidylinositol 4-kinase type 2-beta [Trichinella pseudospiralis]